MSAEGLAQQQIQEREEQQLAPRGRLEPLTYKCQTCSGFHTKFTDCNLPSEIVKKIEYKNGFKFHVPEDQSYLQVQFLAYDQDERVVKWQFGRKWMLSTHMTRSEVVQTAFKAIMSAEEHETREMFRYKGQAIFGPHFNVEALVKLAEQGQLDPRQPLDS